MCTWTFNDTSRESTVIYVQVFKAATKTENVHHLHCNHAQGIVEHPLFPPAPKLHTSPATPGRSIVFNQLQLQNLRRRTNPLRPSVGWLPSWVLVGVCGNSPSKCQAYSWETSVSCLKIHRETLGEQIHPLSQLRDIILGRPHTRLQARTSMLNLSCWLFGREATIGSLKQS